MLGNNRRKSKAKNAELNRFFRIQLLALFLYVLFFIILSLISLLMDLSKEYIYYVSLVIFCIAPFLVGFISGVKIRKNGLLVGAIHALPIGLLFVILSAIINGFQIDLRTLITIAIMILSSAIGGIVSVNIKLK